MFVWWSICALNLYDNISEILLVGPLFYLKKQELCHDEFPVWTNLGIKNV